MRPACKFVVIFFSALALCFPSFGQKNYPYNISTLNGLPTNYVYMTTTDSWGYLWMATERGVVKYNGYKAKVFNYANGLVNEDIYGLQKAANGKIWLYSFLGRPQYIQNDQLRLPVNADDFLFFRCHNIVPYQDGVLFLIQDKIFGVKGDSIVHLNALAYTINKHGEAFTPKKDSIVRFSINNYKVTSKKSCPVHIGKNYTGVPLGRKVLYYFRSGNLVKVFDPENCSLGYLRIYDETGKPDSLWFMTYMETADKVLALGSHNIYELDTNLNVRRTAISSLVDWKEDMTIMSFMRDSLWGECISTRRNGIYIVYPKLKGLIIYADEDLRGYKPLGVIEDTITYWWNSSRLTLAKICKGKVEKRTMPELSSAHIVLPKDDKQSYFLGGKALQLMDNRSLSFKNLIDVFIFDKKVVNVNEMFGFADDILFTDSLNGFLSSLSKIRLSRERDTMHISQIDNDVYNAMLYDSTSRLLIAWGNAIYVYHTPTEKHIKIPLHYFSRLGIYKIKAIFYDPVHENILIQDHNSIYFYDLYRHRFIRLLKNLNLDDATVLLKDRRIVVAGKFGVAICRLTGYNRISKPVIHNNAKEQYYTEITGMLLSGNNLMLNTDRHMYHMDLDRMAPTGIRPGNRLLGNYNDSVFAIAGGDTIYTTQENNKIQYDVVNPYGSGELRFYYTIAGVDSVWNKLVANEMTIPSFKPGIYHKVYLSMSDDVWNSDRVPVYFYVQPYWWQTTTGRNIIWTGSVLLLLGLLYSVYGITRSVITRNNQKRNKLLELEIKSVYAQINPHFIFNSLNSALSFIELNKSREAYDHIFRFSGLLRGFLKSSRNRYITIEEEVKNLRNYIELQQTRFMHVFTYDVEVDDSINTQKATIPSLLLQPLVENAINHGLLPKEVNGHLSIRFKSGPRVDEIICLIEDNGIGRAASRELSVQRTGGPKVSYGSLLISELIDVFNKYEKTKITLSYIDKELPETGLIVLLTFKNH